MLNCAEAKCELGGFPGAPVWRIITMPALRAATVSCSLLGLSGTSMLWVSIVIGEAILVHEHACGSVVWTGAGIKLLLDGECDRYVN